MRSAGSIHALVTTDAVGGVWTYSLDLARGLLERGVEVTLAVLGPAPSPEQTSAAEALGRLMLIETGLPLDWTEDDPARLSAASRSLAALAVERQVDLVHLNSPTLAAEARFTAPVVGGCHSCLATWWTAVRGDEEMPADFRWRTDLLSRGYAACDALIAPSSAFRQATSARYGVSPVTVHNGRAAPSGSGTSGRERAALTSGRLWDEGKNIRALDLAAGRMRFPVRAAGSLTGPNGPAAAPRHLQRLGRLDSETLRKELERCPVFVSLALYEPFGLGVLEAAQAGCALVLSDIATFRELWEGAAVFVPPHDDETAAQVLDGLLEDPDAAAALGAAARERAERYSVSHMVEGTLRVYDQVLSMRRAHRVAAA